LSVTLLLLGGIGVIGGCSGDQRPSVIFVIMDTTRYDRLGCAGYARATTPTLDSLATSGVRFATTITAAPVTGPAITTILSSVLPPVHGVRDNRRFALNPNLGLLAEVFRDAGYQTGAVVGAVPLLGRFGYNRGFASYDDRFSEDQYRTYSPGATAKRSDLRESERRAGAVTDRCLAWLAQAKRNRPVFLLAHYFDPHGPYDPPPAFAALHPADPYDAEIAYMDSEIGRLLAGARDLLGDGIRVVAVGDHGEGLFDHNEMAHGFFVYDTTIKVPLIFSGEGAASGLVVTAAVRTVDIAPTVCHWLGIAPLATFTGTDLSAGLRGEPIPTTCDTAYVETFWTQLHYSWSPLQGIRTPAWKWIKAPRPELYDLATDPGEQIDLAGSSPTVAEQLQAQLEEQLAALSSENQHLGAGLAEIDPDLDRKLEALGYVSGSRSTSVVPDYSLPDPKDRNRQWNPEERRLQHWQAANRLYENGRIEDALWRLSLAAEITPLRKAEAALHGLLLSRSGRHHEALVAYRQALQTEEDPQGQAFIRVELARLLATLGHQKEATAQIDTLRASPHTPPPLLEAAVRLEEQMRDQAQRGP
jgi:arylsulfatase A-like enzyme